MNPPGSQVPKWRTIPRATARLAINNDIRNCIIVNVGLTVGEYCWLGEVEANCGEPIQKERHKDDEWINILKDISENNDHDHDGDGNDWYQEGDGEPTNPVEPVREAHHFCQLLHSRLLLLYNPLEKIAVIDTSH